MEESLEWLMRQCSLREYCVWDVKEKLRRKGVSGEKADKIVQRLLKDGYVSDRRYARAYISDKSILSGWGMDKIFFNLRRKSIPETLLVEVWEEFDENQQRLDKMTNVISNKWNSLSKEEPRKRVEKTLRFALGRGFRYEQIMKVIEDCKQNLN
jgi:regulatory protein